MTKYRTDLNNNPTAFTTDLAREAGLVENVEYSIGDPFTVGTTVLHTAKLLIDPIQTTIKVIDKIGFYTSAGQNRWAYMGMPKSIWDTLAEPQKIYIIAFMYRREVGTEMIHLFPVSVITRLGMDKH